MEKLTERLSRVVDLPRACQCSCTTTVDLPLPQNATSQRPGLLRHANGRETKRKGRNVGGLWVVAKHSSKGVVWDALKPKRV